jgi:hypothetical protein
MDQDLLVLAQAKTSISINNDATPRFLVGPAYIPFQPPLIFRNCAV